jgi:hypothetical protein
MKKNYLLTLLFSLAMLQAFAQCSNTSCVFVASSQAMGNSDSVTIAKPSGVQQNDVMIAAVHAGWCNLAGPITPPSGWTLINQTSNTGSGCGSSNTGVQLATFYKVASASEPATYTFTGNTIQEYVGGIVAYSGVNTINPINAVSNNGLQDSCASLRATGVTTTAACTRLVGVFFCSVNFSGNNIIPQGSMTERVDVGTTGNHPWGNENLAIADEAMTSAGPSGDRVAGLANCNSDGWVTGAQLIALRCDVSTGIQTSFVTDLFEVHPNPSSGIFAISMHGNLTNTCFMAIYDCFGRTIEHLEINAQQMQVDLSTQPKGIYFLKIVSPEGAMIKKIVVE